MKLYIKFLDKDKYEVELKDFAKMSALQDWDFNLYGEGTEEDPHMFVAEQLPQPRVTLNCCVEENGKFTEVSRWYFDEILGDCRYSATLNGKSDEVHLEAARLTVEEHAEKLANEVRSELDNRDDKSFAVEFSRNMNNAAVGELLLQYIGAYTDVEDKYDLKVMAIDFGEILGPDHAQTLYSLARYVTKLA